VAKKKAAKRKSPRRAPAGRAADKRARDAALTRPLKGLLMRRLREAQSRRVLLFLSTGNTCRSPMAATYFKKLLEERKIRHIEVRSAGVMTIAGLLATDESKLMLEPYGVTLDKHRSQPLTDEIIRRADLILGMTPFHMQMALRMSSEARGKTFLLKEFTKTDPKNRPIPDPMGCTLEVYKRCFRQIKQACDKLIDMEFTVGKTTRPARAGAAKARGGGKPSRRAQKKTTTAAKKKAEKTRKKKTAAAKKKTAAAKRKATAAKKKRPARRAARPASRSRKAKPKPKTASKKRKTTRKK
jgi:protein-tyrosine-phosphatase